MELAAGAAPREGARRERRAGGVLGVPARIMGPRIVLYVTTFALTVFGLLMIYSASSIMALSSSDYDNNPAYFVIRQAIFGGAGVILAVVLAHVDYHAWHGHLLRVVWVGSLLLLGLIYTPIARGAYGASRWISVAGLTLQPSELAKVVVLLTAANLCRRYYQDGELWRDRFVLLLAVGVGLPLALILFQPDKGTTGILVLTVLIMLYLAGMSMRYLAPLLAAGVAVALVLAFKDDYARQRVMTMLDPFLDPYGAGYQLVQGFYAFATGGLFGVGLGLSRQKYSYLPMAHNDFIFAVIGEELGLVGTVGVLAAFGLLIWAGFRIAESAPDLTGRLVAAGCTSLIAIQLLLNVCGVLGLFPLSGKPVPFISYGGTSLVSCLMLVGLIASVSRRSTLPETEADRRRDRLVVVRGGEDGRLPRREPAVLVRPRRQRQGGRLSRPSDLGWRTEGADGRQAGQPESREETQAPARSNLRLVEGGRGSTRSFGAGGGTSGRWGRVDLDEAPASRLRTDEVQVRDGRPPRRRR